MNKLAKIFITGLVILFALYHVWPIIAAGANLAAKFKPKEDAASIYKNVCQKEDFKFLSQASPLDKLYQIKSNLSYKPIGQTSSQESGQENLIPNPSLEAADPGNVNKPAFWQSAKWGDNDAEFEYIKSGHDGSRAIQTKINRYASGDARWETANLAADPGQYYIFQNYFKANVYTELSLMVEKNDGSKQYYQLGTLEPSEKWTLYKTSFFVPIGAKHIKLSHIIKSSGYLITDDYKAQKRANRGFQRPIVSLTFDDGWRSIYTNGLPILEKNNIKSTQYLVSGYLGLDNYMTKEQASEFKDSGHEIASHTVSHADLSKLNSYQRLHELAISKSSLNQDFGGIYNFASPYGRNDVQIRSEIMQCYQTHRSTDTGYNTKDLDITHLKVQNVDRNTTIDEFNSWLDFAKTNNLWLILVYHQIEEGESDYSVAPNIFNQQVSAINQRQLPTLTVAEALAETVPQADLTVFH